EGFVGVVEEIGLTYTFIRIEDNDRLVVPNEKIASDSIRNSSIRSRRKLAHVTVQVPLDTDLEAARTLLREAAQDERAEVSVVDLAEKASLQVSGRGARGAECRAARERAPPARARAPARGRGLRVTPPPPPRGRGRRGDDELEHVLRSSRKRRGRIKTKRKRRATLIFVVLLVIVLAVIASGVGAVARFRSDCDLQDLKAVQIGENSFVYAANGSLLGAIPAERNRTPVALWRVSPWMSKATVAIEDHRFYQHG